MHSLSPGSARQSASCLGRVYCALCASIDRIVDDMRPSLGAYNVSAGGSNAMAHTPNIDKLASESLTFKRAYVQYGRCAS